MFGAEGYEVVAINDLTSPKMLAHLLKYDSAQGRYEKADTVSAGEDSITVDGKEIKIYAKADANELPWGEIGVDVVLECTGFYTSKEKSMAHINAGAKKVLISAPGKGDMKTIVYGVNDDVVDGNEQIVSAASCTTNCLAPVLNVINKKFGIKEGMMSTIHAYTNDQNTLDGNHNKGITSRRGRGCFQNIIPTSTGAAGAIGKVIPELKGKLIGCAYRVPVSDGSMIDLTLELDKNVTIEQINQSFIDAQSSVLKVTNDPVVSSDVVGNKCGALVDLSLTNVLGSNGRLVKIVAWYDNEMGYTSQMMKTAKVLFR
jgi:glyceraldehyde 3-phosphate dehydrogenase